MLLKVSFLPENRIKKCFIIDDKILRCSGEILVVGNIENHEDRKKAEYFDLNKEKWISVSDYPFEVTESYR